MSWLSGFARHVEAEGGRRLAHLGLGQVAEGKAQHVELPARGGEQEVALVLGAVGGPLQRAVGPAIRARHLARDDVVAGRQHVGAEILRRGEQVAELHGLVAGHAGDGRAPRQVGVGEGLDHALAKARLVVQHVVREAARLGHAARVVNVLARAARAAPLHGRAVVVELQRHADHVVALLVQQRRRHRRIHAARHRHDHAHAGRIAAGEEGGMAGRVMAAHVVEWAGRSSKAPPGKVRSTRRCNLEVHQGSFGAHLHGTFRSRSATPTSPVAGPA